MIMNKGANKEPSSSMNAKSTAQNMGANSSNANLGDKSKSSAIGSAQTSRINVNAKEKNKPNSNK